MRTEVRTDSTTSGSELIEKRSSQEFTDLPGSEKTEDKNVEVIGGRWHGQAKMCDIINKLSTY